MPRLFEAQWRGYCWSCGDRWRPGDRIGYWEDELVCEECWDAYMAQAAWEEYFGNEGK